MSSSHHVLLLGGHGKIARYLTPLLLKRSWTVTSVIRAEDQVPTIEKLASGQPGKLNVLVRSIEDAGPDGAASILNEVKPDYVAFSAGAGGKGGAERTFKVDRDAAINFVKAADAVPSITRFLIVSYNGSRRSAAPWWSTADWDEYNRTVNHGVLANYYKAKIAADEALYETSKKSSHLVGICLRPTTLTDDPAGTVDLGKQKAVSGKIPRMSVAQTADALLAADGLKNTWLDLLPGEDTVEQAVQKCVSEGTNAAEGEAFY